MKSMVKILFAIMALSLGEVSVSAAGKKRPAAAAVEEQATNVEKDRKNAEILRCLKETLFEAQGRSMLDPKTGESLSHILTALDTTGAAITFISSGAHTDSMRGFTAAVNSLGITALVQAIALGNEASVAVLLPSTDLLQELCVGKSKTTYLHLACQQDKDAIFNMVLAELLKQCAEAAQKTAALMTEDSQGFTAAQTALNLGKHDRLAKLVGLPECPMIVGPNRGSQSLLHLAIARGNSEALRTLIAPNVLATHHDKNLVNAPDTAGNTAVHYAALAIALESNRDFFTILYGLVANEAVPATNKPNFTCVNNSGQTPIMLVINTAVQESLVKTYPELAKTILQPQSLAKKTWDLLQKSGLNSSAFVVPAGFVASSAAGFAFAGITGAAAPTAAVVATYLWQNLKHRVDLTAAAASLGRALKRSKPTETVVVAPSNDLVVIAQGTGPVGVTDALVHPGDAKI